MNATPVYGFEKLTPLAEYPTPSDDPRTYPALHAENMDAIETAIKYRRASYDYVIYSSGDVLVVDDSHGVPVIGHTDISDIIANCHGNILICTDIYPTSTIIIKDGDRIKFAPGCITYPQNDVDVFYFRKNSALENPIVDTSGISFTHSVYYFSAAERFYTGAISPLYASIAKLINARAIGGTGTGTGNALCLESVRGIASSWGFISGIEAEIYINGYEYGCLMHCDGRVNTDWINANVIKIIANNCVNFIYELHTGLEPGDISGNTYFTWLQWGANSVTGITLGSSYAKVYPLSLIWDVPFGSFGLHFLPKSAQNFAIAPCQNLEILDEGKDNLVVQRLHNSANNTRTENHGERIGLGVPESVAHNLTGIPSIAYIQESTGGTITGITSDATYVHPNVTRGARYKWFAEYNETHDDKVLIITLTSNGSLFTATFTTSVTTTLTANPDDSAVIVTASGTSHVISYTPDVGTRTIYIAVAAGLDKISGISCPAQRTIVGLSNVNKTNSLITNVSQEFAGYSTIFNNPLSDFNKSTTLYITFTNITGTPDQLCSTIRDFRAVGATSFTGSLDEFPATMWILYIYANTAGRITAAPIEKYTQMREFKLYSLGWSSANVDTVLLSASDAVWDDLEHYIYGQEGAGPSLRIDDNAVPGGSAGADTTSPMTTPGSGNSNSDWSWDAGVGAHKALTGKAAVYYLKHLVRHTWTITYQMS